VEKQEEQHDILNSDFEAFLLKYKRHLQQVKEVEECVNETAKKVLQPGSLRQGFMILILMRMVPTTGTPQIQD
jgi:hypothetical protein